MSTDTAQASTSYAAATSLPAVEGTEPDRCALDAFRIAIASKLIQVFPSITLSQAYTGVDYSKKDSDFTVALPRFKLGGKPAEHAAKFKEAFVSDEWIESVETNNAGFLMFKCNPEGLARKVLTQINELTTNRGQDNEKEYGHSDIGKGKKILIEYSSPNIAKEFHVGHLRSTIIGAFLVNLYKACGYDVVSLNYLGDWGKQFGLIAVGYEKYGDEEEMKRDPIKHLYNVYVQINKDLKAEKPEAEKKDFKAKQDESGVAESLKPQEDKDDDEAESGVDAAARAYFKRMESGDEDSLVNWRQWRELSIKQYEEQYKVLNVKFDEYLGESMVSHQKQVEAVTQLEKMGLVSDSKGAKLIDLEQWKLGKAILLKR
ncbi:hypothetical protein FRC18_003229, partial [Serendipita sp. 400]